MTASTREGWRRARLETILDLSLALAGPRSEGEVVAEAGDVIDDGKPRTLEFGVADETAWRVGLSCGGRIRVFVERVD